MQSSLQKFQKTDDLAPVVELCVAQQKKTFPLLVKTLTGKKIEIMTDLGDTIRTVKSIIQQQEAIKLNLQKLLYAGRKLEDNKTLSDYKIKQGEWIYLVIRNKEDDDDSDEDKDDSEGEEERETKQAPSDKEKIGPIEVEYKNELLFTIDVSKGETIGDIKQKILAKAEIDNLRLLHDGKRVVDDQKTVEDYKFFGPSNKLQVQGDLKSKYASEFSLNIVCQQIAHQQQVSSTTQVKDLRRIVSGLVKYSFTLVFDGKVLLDENATLSSYGISKTVDVVAVPDSNGGNSLRFIQTIETFPAIQNSDELKNSLNFLPDQQGLNEIFSQELDSVKGMTQYKSHKPEEVLAARLWTSNILYKQLNECLANNKDLKPWGIYLKCLIKGLKHMNFYRGKVYKGVKGSQNLENYQQGSKVSWKTFVGLTRSKDKAKNAAGDNGVIFEVDAVSTRDLSKITLCSSEEFVLLPYSSFEVTEVVNTPNQPTLIKLRELAMLKGTKQLLWVDDNPEYNYYHAQPLEEKDTSVVFCTSTKDARDLFESHGWLLALDDSKFRVVSDMVRDENGKPNYIAGIQLLKAIFEDYKSNARSMIFCNNLQKANESAANENLKGNYKIANQDDELDQFISFS